MKKLIILIIIGIMTFTGCKYYSNQNNGKQHQLNTGTGKNNQENRPVDKQKEVKQKEGKYQYLVGANVQPKVIQEWAKIYHDFQGVYQQKINGYRGVLINLGYALNSGYQVKVERVIKKQDKWTVEVALKEPDPGKVNNEVISYPYNVISIVDDGKPIEVLEVKENSKKALPIVIIPEGEKLAVSKNFLIISPLGNEKITSPVVIKGKARVFEASFSISIEDGHKILAQKTVMAKEGAPAFGDFECVLPFTKPTNSKGFIVFSYANMSNGKMIKELMHPVKF